MIDKSILWMLGIDVLYHAYDAGWKWVGNPDVVTRSTFAIWPSRHSISLLTVRGPHTIRHFLQTVQSSVLSMWRDFVKEASLF